MRTHRNSEIDLMHSSYHGNIWKSSCFTFFGFYSPSILFITDDGILYSAATGNMIRYYSFADNISHEVALPKFEETHSLHIDSYLTYDEKAFYFYDYGEISGISRILQLSYNDWSLDVVAEGKILSETEDYRVNQTDDEYFYQGDQMYPVP